jgi:hypothetical protein
MVMIQMKQDEMNKTLSVELIQLSRYMIINFSTHIKVSTLTQLND